MEKRRPLTTCMKRGETVGYLAVSNDSCKKRGKSWLFIHFSPPFASWMGKRGEVRVQYKIFFSKRAFLTSPQKKLSSSTSFLSVIRTTRKREGREFPPDFLFPLWRWWFCDFFYFFESRRKEKKEEKPFLTSLFVLEQNKHVWTYTSHNVYCTSHFPA